MMTRRMLSLILGLSAPWAAVQASLPVERPAFASSPVSAAVLAQSHGTGVGFAENFAPLVSERLRVDERTFATLANVSMDIWWNEVGNGLIAANLYR